VSREGGLVFNNLFLTTAAATVFLGTFYPLLIDLIGNDKISVGPPYYNRTFIPIVIPLILGAAVGPFLKWKRDRLADAIRRLKAPALISTAAIILVMVISFGHRLIPALAIGLAFWLIAGSLAVLAYRIRLGRVSLSKSWSLAAITPRSFYGLVIAHAGLGLTIAGITGVSAWSQEAILMMRPGQTTALAGYEIRLVSVDAVPGPNYSADRANFEVARNGRRVTSLASERRYYPVREQQTIAAGIRTNFLSNIYIAIGEPNPSGAWTVRMYHHPLAPWIWLGGFMMALGGLVSLADRRLRVGAPQPARRPIAITPALAGNTA
jgi:cytochrome c-type biogenesis protein CcmF